MIRGTGIACVLVAAAGIAVVAVPRFLHPVFGCTNDLSAWATLRNLVSAESNVRDAATIDLDGDGAGEFAFPGELCGAADVPGTTAPIEKWLLSGAFRTAAPDGRIRRSGYFIRLWLPDSRGDGVSESGSPPPPVAPPRDTAACCNCGAPERLPRSARGGPTDRVDPKLASRKWCAYAWPVTYGRSGTRTFFIDQDGVDLSVDDPHYSGDDGPLPGAAFESGGAVCITGTPAEGRAAQDGNVWRAASPRR